MKMILVFFICSISFVFCTMMAEQNRKDTKNNVLATGSDTIDFKTQVQPILEKNCTPCHFPGGKMYDKMPFDKGETIIAHNEKLVKRIKDEEELALIKQFISQNQ